MKQIMGLICLALFCPSVAWLEYEMVLNFGSMLILFAAAPVLTALLVALLRAPEGYERPDGFHLRTRARGFNPTRHATQRARVARTGASP